MTHSKNICIPDPVIRRLTRYLEAVREYSESGSEWISSQEIADSLGLTSSTVRQDLSYLDFSGISKRGYQVGPLRDVIENSLGTDSTHKVVIIGAGNLGRALAAHSGFTRGGFAICGIFDSDTRLTGTRIGALKVREMHRLAGTVRKKNADIGMIAVPGPSAQKALEDLLHAGIRGILNFSSAHLNGPKGASIVDVRIVASLQELVYRMKSSGKC
ncbi:MAG: redox-sensing transcriptional repressor Rex [Kiritimatiellia bacterium]